MDDGQRLLTMETFRLARYQEKSWEMRQHALYQEELHICKVSNVFFLPNCDDCKTGR